MRIAAFAAAGAAALSPVILQQDAAAQGPAAPATGWWYAGRSGEAPQRQLVFIDRGTVRSQAGNAGARVMTVFEQPQGDVRSFAVTYGFQCRARRFQTRDAIFSTTAGTNEPAAGIVQEWKGVEPGSVAALVFDAACSGRMSDDARRIAATPQVEAARMFGERAAQAGPPPRAGAGGLMSRDEAAACLRQSAGPVSAACRDARASAERGRATTGNGAYGQLLDRIVQADSQDWEINTYIPGSMQIADLRRDASGNIAVLRGNYRYGRRTTPGLPYWREAGGGWVEARFVNGRLNCLQYHDRPRCITSTRDYYEEGRAAARDHAEYCAVTGNC